MEQKHIVIQRDLRDAAVDRAANCLATATKIKKDPRGVSPGARTGVQVVLNFQMLAKKTPFAFIASALQQFELLEPRKHWLVAIQRLIKSGSPSPHLIA